MWKNKNNNFTLKRSCNITQSAVANLNSLLFVKVEKISKGSLDSIPSPSPSMKIQTMGRKFCLRWKGKTLLEVCWHHPAMFCLITSSKLANILNFLWRWRWWDWIQAIFSNLFYFMKSQVRCLWYLLLSGIHKINVQLFKLLFLGKNCIF